MKSNFVTGDVISVVNWMGNSIQYVVLETRYPSHIFTYSQTGHVARIPREEEHYYAKIGHINLNPLCEHLKR